MSQLRRLPVYLLLDTSGSMRGQPIEAVRQGIRALMDDLRRDPQALETAYLSVITFGGRAQQLAPLTEVMQFQEPVINAGGSTVLGAALTEVMQCIDREVVHGSATQKGDWKPLIFLMSDGHPTDAWKRVADQIKLRNYNIIACAAGDHADADVFKRITEMVVALNDIKPATLQAFFKWVSSSIKTSSQQIERKAYGSLDLPPAPPEMKFVP